MRNSPKAKSLALFVAFAVSLVTMVFVFSEPVMAQATTGTIKGTVLDPQGAAVQGAAVTVKNEVTGIEQSTTTGGGGNFTVPNLPPGKYKVTVTQQGFSTRATTGVDVRIGTDTDLRIELAIGTPTETVTVVAGEETVQSTTAQISASFESRKVEELPSNAAGGGIDTLALLAPGIVPGFGNVNSNGVTLSVNGNRARSNNFTLDGTDNNDLTIGGPNFFISNQDSVQEFQLITTNYSAQYGRNQGAIINIVTKSGTNEFHGTGFLFHRNASALDAMTNIERRDPGRSQRDKFISNVFGGTFGGPFVRNRAFFFVDGQLIRQREQFQFRGGNPAIIREDFPLLTAAFPGNAAIQAIVNQNVFAVQPNARPRADRAGGTLCFPRDITIACSGANAVIVRTAFPEYPLPLPFDQKEYGLRGDVNLTSRDSFNIKWRTQDSPEAGFLGGANGFGGDIPFKSRNLNGAYTRQFGTRAVNEFRAAWQKLSVIFGDCSNHPGGTDPLKGCIPHADDIGTAFTNITFTGVSSAGVTMQSIGPATNLPQGREVRVFQLADIFTWTKGRHTLTFGIDFRDLDNSVPFLPNINGAFRFPSALHLAAGVPSFVTIGAGEPRIGYKERDQFYFIQDDWKVRENLTLNLGLRYEYTGQPINLLNEITTARENDPAQALWLQSLPLEARTVPSVPADKNNFAPRLGFAWSPRFGDSAFSRFMFGENDATVIRGGYSIAYEPAFYNILLNVSTSAPTVFLNTVTNTCTNKPAAQCTTLDILQFPRFRMPANPTGDVVRTSLGSFLQRNTFDPRLLAQTQVSPDFHSPFSHQWSFGVQRQVNRNNVFEVRYVGNKGKDLFQTVNRNPFLGLPTLNTNPASPCFNQFTNGGLRNGFCSAGFGGTAFIFPGFANLIPSGVTPAANGRVLGDRGLIRSRENTGSSEYHALQSRYNGRIANQLTIGGSYTWSKTLDNASEIFAFGENAIASNVFDLQNNEKGLSGNDRRHAAAINFIWDVPIFKNQEGFVGHVLGGWQFNGVYNAASGRTFTPSQFFNVFGLPTYQDFTFTATFFGFDHIRPFAGNRNAPRTAIGISDVDASFFGYTGVFTPSPTGFYSLNELNTSGNLVPVTANDVRYILNGPGMARRTGNPFGNVSRGSERGPALNILNLGIFKNTKVSENVRVQFRAELFNALNHPNPGYGVAAGATLPDFFIDDAPLFHDWGEIELSSRRVQFGIRIIF